MSYVCDHCASTLVREGKIAPHVEVFGANCVYYRHVACDLCGKVEDCVSRPDLRAEVPTLAPGERVN